MDFDIGKNSYNVVRGIKPNVFEITCNGELIEQQGATEYQKHLETNILKRFNQKVFENIVALGSRNYTPFMQLKTAERRAFIEEFFDINVFTQMRKILNDKTAAVKKSIETVEADIRVAMREAEIFKEQYTDLTQKSKDRLKEAEGARNEIVSSIETTKAVIEKLQASIAGKEKQDTAALSNKIDKLKEFATIYKTKQADLERKDKFFTDHDNCPTCKQQIADGFRQEMLSENKADLDETAEKLSQIMKNLAKLNDELKNVTAQNEELQGVILDIGAAENKLESLSTQLERKDAEILKLSSDNESEIDGIKQRLKDIKSTLDGLKEEKADYEADLDLHKIAASMLKDTGIKAKLIEQYIPHINMLINHYLATLDFYVEFVLNENFEETIRSRYRDQFVYNNFSEGQKSRIDLAIIFAWRGMAKMKAGVDTNLMIMDEVFDGSMDSDGADDLFKVMDEFDDMNIFVISHNSDMKDRFETEYKFALKQNFTVMEKVE